MRSLALIALLVLLPSVVVAAGDLKGFAGPVVPILDRLDSKPATRTLIPLVDELNAAMPPGSGVTFVYQRDRGTPCENTPVRWGVNTTPLGTITVCDAKGLLDGAAGRGATEGDATNVLRGRVWITNRGLGRNALCHELMHIVAHAAHEDADPSIGGCLANTTVGFGPDDARLLALAYP